MKTLSQLKLLIAAALVVSLPASAAAPGGGAHLNGTMMSRGNMSGITVVDPAIRGMVASSMRAQSQERAAASASIAEAANHGQGSAMSSAVPLATGSQHAAPATPIADAARADHAAFSASRVAAGQAHRQGK